MKKLAIFALTALLTINSSAKEDIDEVITKLSDLDRKAVIDLKQELATWSKKVKEEISTYQSETLALRAELKNKYEALSPDAKSGLKKEEELTAKISPEGLAILNKAAADYKDIPKSSGKK